ncbi:MAG: cytochrome c [Solirubrobacterales bacterium]|jgi:mono/diheme cytochrome c family protein|nr:cytochrome c [Solirubrobacterales bacterium]
MLCAVMRRVLTIAFALAAAVSFSACGDKSNLPADESASVKRGAELFAERCHGCHTMDTVGAEGGASEVRDRERVDGPNFNVRVESKENVLYAIRNGGYSGAIMPENIVVGKDADMVADFLSKYAGGQAKEQRSNSENKVQDSAR